MDVPHTCHVGVVFVECGCSPFQGICLQHHLGATAYNVFVTSRGCTVRCAKSRPFCPDGRGDTTGGCRLRPHPKPPPPSSMDPKMVVWINAFCGRQRRRRFYFWPMAGDEILFHHMCVYSGCSEFSGDFKHSLYRKAYEKERRGRRETGQPMCNQYATNMVSMAKNHHTAMIMGTILSLNRGRRWAMCGLSGIRCV